MTENIDGDISRLINNYSLLMKEFEHYEEGKSKFASREVILDLMIRNQNEIRTLKKKKLSLKNKKNNSNE